VLYWIIAVLDGLPLLAVTTGTGAALQAFKTLGLAMMFTSALFTQTF